jgi:hypothetical protein
MGSEQAPAPLCFPAPSGSEPCCVAATRTPGDGDKHGFNQSTPRDKALVALTQAFLFLTM